MAVPGSAGAAHRREDGVSAAGPMDPDKRAIYYTEILAPDGSNAGWRRMTPAQRRRWTRKAHRDGFAWPVTGKGRPTPRQRRQVSRG